MHGPEGLKKLLGHQSSPCRRVWRRLALSVRLDIDSADEVLDVHGLGTFSS